MTPIHLSDTVERRILEARKAGLFDDLPGKGNPLDLEENPFVRREWRLAYRVLKNAGFTLDWIELDKSIRSEIVQCHKLLEDRLAWAHQLRSSPDGRIEVEAELEDVYRCTIADYTERATGLNERIRLLNLMVPLMQLQRSAMPIVEELRRFRRSWPKSTSDLAEGPPMAESDHARRE